MIDISCPDAKEIMTTKAVYGQYFLSSCQGASGCCAPSMKYDCQEDVETEHLLEWEVIRYLCDNKTSCSATYEGVVMHSCGSGYVADYLQIFYDCFPHDVTAPVGFTAHVPDSFDAIDNEVLGFTQVLSNIGGHFCSYTSSFVCPDHGVYMFSMTICTHDDYLRVILFQNNNLLAYALPDDASSSSPDAECQSPSVIVECNVGDVIWVMCDEPGHVNSAYDITLLSGALLHRY